MKTKKGNTNKALDFTFSTTQKKKKMQKKQRRSLYEFRIQMMYNNHAHFPRGYITNWEQWKD